MILTLWPFVTGNTICLVLSYEIYLFLFYKGTHCKNRAKGYCAGFEKTYFSIETSVFETGGNIFLSSPIFQKQFFTPRFLTPGYLIKHSHALKHILKVYFVSISWLLI